MVVHVYDGLLVIYTLCAQTIWLQGIIVLRYIDLFYFNLIFTFTLTIPGNIFIW